VYTPPTVPPLSPELRKLSMRYHRNTIRNIETEKAAAALTVQHLSPMNAKVSSMTPETLYDRQ